MECPRCRVSADLKRIAEPLIPSEPGSRASSLPFCSKFDVDGFQRVQVQRDRFPHFLPNPKRVQTLKLDCYWVGSLDFNFFGNRVGFSVKPQQLILFAGKSTATKQSHNDFTSHAFRSRCRLTRFLLRSPSHWARYPAFEAFRLKRIRWKRGSGRRRFFCLCVFLSFISVVSVFSVFPYLCLSFFILSLWCSCVLYISFIVFLS